MLHRDEFGRLLSPVFETHEDYTIHFVCEYLREKAAVTGESPRDVLAREIADPAAFAANYSDYLERITDEESELVVDFERTGDDRIIEAFRSYLQGKHRRPGVAEILLVPSDNEMPVL